MVVAETAHLLCAVFYHHHVHSTPWSEGAGTAMVGMVVGMVATISATTIINEAVRGDPSG
jgi:RsiW-degrading membrane proteinase PrsW (M82 family)